MGNWHSLTLVNVLSWRPTMFHKGEPFCGSLFGTHFELLQKVSLHLFKRSTCNKWEDSQPQRDQHPKPLKCWMLSFSGINPHNVLWEIHACWLEWIWRHWTGLFSGVLGQECWEHFVSQVPLKCSSIHRPFRVQVEGSVEDNYSHAPS